MEFKKENEIEISGEQLFDARFHPIQSNLVAAVTIEGHVHLIEDGILKSRIKKHHKGSSIRKVRFFDDGRMVTIAKTVKIHDLDSKQTLHTLRCEEDKQSTLYSVKPFSTNIVGAGDDDGAIHVWDTRTPEQPIFYSNDCDQYISDIDGKYESRKLIVCTSGEGTLTAYDMRAKKMIEPQSELFEAGFQCVKLIDSNKKVVIGGEDGALYVFNQNEWAHTSGKFAIGTDLHNRGECSIDCLDYIPESSIFLAGCSDGRMRSVTLWPHKMISENIFCKGSSIESLQINPTEDKNNIVISGGSYVNIVTYSEKEQDGSDSDDEIAEQEKVTCDGGSEPVLKPDDVEGDSVADSKDEKTIKKKQKINDDDYLKIFS